MISFNTSEVIASSLSYNGEEIMKDLYYLREGDGTYLEDTPAQVYARVAKQIYPDDKSKESVLFHLLYQQVFQFNSPVLFNSGSKDPLLVACFVGNLEDSMQGILQEATKCATIFKHGAGYGLEIGALRPKMDLVTNTKGYSSGPVSFLHLFNTLSEIIKAGGKRRAAFLSMMRVDHPDIEQYIHCKDDGSALSNMNLSVAIPNSFMEAVQSDSKYPLMFNGKEYRQESASRIFNIIAESAWKTGDPGIWFPDTANLYNPVYFSVGPIKSTNACGEVGVPPNNSCNLASINLNKFLTTGPAKIFDYNSYARVVEIVTEAMDCVIDRTIYPDKQIEDATKAIRPLGLGFTGLAQVLFEMRIPYDSDRARAFARNLMEVTTRVGIRTSFNLAKIHKSYPAYDEAAHLNLLELYSSKSTEPSLWHILARDIKRSGIGLRNAFNTCLAPTGSISLILDSGTYAGEPAFSHYYEKQLQASGKVLTYVNQSLVQALKDAGIYSDELMDKIKDHGGSIQNISEIPAAIKSVFVTAHDISYKDRIMMQAALQDFTTMSISSTVNLPNNATVDDIKEIYKLAHKLGLKGITIYRDGCRAWQPMTKKSTPKVAEAVKGDVVVDRPKVTSGLNIKCATPSGNIFVSLGKHPQTDKLLEVFINIKHSHQDVEDLTCALGRLLSLSLHLGGTPQQILDSIGGIGGLGVFERLKEGDSHPAYIKSIPDAVAKLIHAYVLEEEDQKSVTPEIGMFEECPSCHRQSYTKIEGCLKCVRCGFSNQCS